MVCTLCPTPSDPHSFYQSNQGRKTNPLSRYKEDAKKANTTWKRCRSLSIANDFPTLVGNRRVTSSWLLVFSIFILPSDSLPPTKKKKRYICTLDHSSNARGRCKDNCSCSTPRRKETGQLMVDQAGAQRDPRSTQRVYSCHIQVNSSSLGLAVVVGIEVLQAERRTPGCSIGF